MNINRKLSVLSRMFAVVQDSDDIRRQIAALEIQAVKYQRLNNRQVVDGALDELSKRQAQVKILDNLSREFFGCEIEDLREKALRYKVVITQYEERLLELFNLEEALQILEKSHGAASADSVAEYDEQISHLKEIIDTGIPTRLTEICPKAEEVEELLKNPNEEVIIKI